ncbi:MAG: glycosyltransferase family 4 protein [Betaproteobacteria bacterium]|jgi:glycosyltransferase involved in cell wall biosynthesis
MSPNIQRVGDQPLAPSIGLIVLFTGDISSLLAQAKQLLFDLRYYAERDDRAVEMVLVIDGPAWRDALSADELNIPSAQTVVRETATQLPGVMANAAAELLSASWLAFLGIGSEISTWYSNLSAWRDILAATSAEAIAGYRSASEGRSAANESYLVHQNDQFSSDYPHAWLQMLDLVPMCNVFVRHALLRRIGGFTEAAVMQRMWWWEFCLRVTRTKPIVSVPMQPVPGPNWHHYPFTHALALPVARALPGLMRVTADPKRVTPSRKDEIDVPPRQQVHSVIAINALSPTWRSLPRATQHRFHEALISRGRPLEIVVVGGVNEPAHNQLCFFNYFALMRDWGAVNWRVVLDERAAESDILGADLVIFSRVRNDAGVALMAACQRHHVATLYMLDDNWIWLGREWDEYAPIFSPGAAPYENFLKLVGEADVTLTYREPLADDLRPYARRVITLPTNVDLRAFVGTVGKKATRRHKIGYVGSLRKNMVAFDALIEIVRRRDDVDLFVMSNALPAEFEALPKARVHFEPYQFNYTAYAATVVAAALDVLVAPVGKTRFEASKCPNKYLEISAAGAVGVYSRAEPYTTYVQDGVTGLFADDAVASWVAAIERLLDDPDQRSKIADQARRHIATQFDTHAVLPAFVEMLLDTVGSRLA